LYEGIGKPKLENTMNNSLKRISFALVILTALFGQAEFQCGTVDYGLNFNRDLPINENIIIPDKVVLLCRYHILNPSSSRDDGPNDPIALTPEDAENQLNAANALLADYGIELLWYSEPGINNDSYFNFPYTNRCDLFQNYSSINILDIYFGPYNSALSGEAPVAEGIPGKSLSLLKIKSGLQKGGKLPVI